MTSAITTFKAFSGEINFFDHTGRIQSRPTEDQFIVIPVANSTYVPVVGDMVLCRRPTNRHHRHRPHTHHHHHGYHRGRTWHRHPYNAQTNLTLFDSEIVLVTITEVYDVASQVVFANRFVWGTLLNVIREDSLTGNFITDVLVDGQSIVEANVANIDALYSAQNTTPL